MTRINVVPPATLSRQHLIAEYRELPRVFSLARKRYKAGQYYGGPDLYTLGTGHVLFFTTRLLFCLIRYQQLVDEMRLRGYNAKPVPLADLAHGISTNYFGNYKPTTAAIKINRQRIKERLNASR